MSNAARPTSNEKTMRAKALSVQRSTLQRGFTLLETVVAFSVLLAALVGPVSLITRGIYNFTFSKNKIIAINLAQEGVELVRQIRDNNIICDQTNGINDQYWAAHPTGGNLAGEYQLDVTQSVTLACSPPVGAPVNIDTPSPSVVSCNDQPPFTIDTNGMYGYGGGNPQTIFRRCVIVCFPPGNTAQSPECVLPPDGLPINGTDQIDIVSRVWWNERGIPREIRLHNRLYNWQ